MMKRLLFVAVACALLVFVLLPRGYVSAERVSTGQVYIPGAPMVTPVSPPSAEKHSPLGVFQFYVPWMTQNVNCDGYVDVATEWSDAAKYDISDTSGQSDGIPDPPGTVDLYVKQDSFGVWFAVVNHADTALEDWDQIGLYFDDDHDGCFPDTLTDEGNIWVYYQTGTTNADWRWLQDHNCDALNYECLLDEWGIQVPVALPCYAMGLTNGRVSYEASIPYGALDHELQVLSPVGALVGFYILAYDGPSGNLHGEWPSQHRSTTWSEPCYYGDFICEGDWYFKPGYHDYAISGMPDFDQKQDLWDNPPGSGNWTYCGPVAIANCLWWFDSKYQWIINPGSPQPPNINDDFDLVTAYGTWDDHDTANVMPLVDDLAWHMDTDGRRTGDGSIGTNVFEMEAAIAEWLLETETDTIFYKHTKKAPDFYWIEEEIERCEDVILLLGFWQYYGPGEWVRVGGHYVTCAGVNSAELTLAISDPYYDMAELGWPGRVLDGILIPHIHGMHGSGVHNDAGNISHDYYMVDNDTLSPGGPWSIPDYPVYDDVIYSVQFANCPLEFEDQAGPYDPFQPVHTEIEYAVAISPIEPGWHLKGEYPDYAPDGMPDFDQNQHGWTAYCGPTAVANCLWWFDSKYQWLTVGGNPPPPFVQDDFNLVETYIPGYDDHSYEMEPVGGYDNVQYLIEDLVAYLGTDPITGTNIQDMQDGIDHWLVDKGLDDVLYEHTLIDSALDPEFFYIIEEEIECCQDVILLLGFWQEWAPGEWRRVGGHYVTCAGVNSDSLQIMFSDPDYDQQVIDYPPDPKWHNNAALVSHDVYEVARQSPSPGGYWWIPNYPEEVGFRHPFENCPDHLQGYQDYPEPGFPIHTEIEAAVLVSPYVKPAAVESLWIYTAFGTAAPGSEDIRLVWSPVTEDTAGCPAYPTYVVYRDTVPSFTPGPAKELATTTDTTYLDVNAAGNSAVNYYYYVNARAGTFESANSRCVGEFDKDMLNAPPPKDRGQKSPEIKRR